MRTAPPASAALRDPLEARATAPPARLAPLLVFAALNSAASGTVTMGIFFLTKSAFAFGPTANYALGLLLGVTYVGGALGAGKLLRALERGGRFGPRGALGLGALAFALTCLLPWLAERAWAVYALGALYMPVAGAFWPVVESYVSGGRAGADLRGAVGRFNVVWSGALVLAFALVSPLVERAPLDVFLLVAAVHAASLLWLAALPPRPGRAAPDAPPLAGEEHPALLALHRPLLAASYLALFALAPYLPVVVAELGVAPEWHTAVASLWMVARVISFFALERWHGWHGRVATAAVGTLLLLAGFGCAVLAPRAPSGVELVLFLLGLAAFGAGAAVLYTSALAYALEHGAAEVEAGGSHEALIGLGYVLGPSAGLAVQGAVALDVVSAQKSEAALTALVAALALAAAAWAWRAGAVARLSAEASAPRRASDGAPPAR